MSKLEFWILGIITAIGLYTATHLPGAGATLTISYLAFAIFSIYKAVQLKSATSLLLGSGYFFYIMGALFKLMHWSGAGLILMLSNLLIFGNILLFINLIKQKESIILKLSSIMVSLGIFLIPIYFILLTWTNVPRHSLSNLHAAIPVIVVFPLILLLINHTDLFKKKSIYGLLLVIGAAQLVSGAIWFRRFLESLA